MHMQRTTQRGRGWYWRILAPRLAAGIVLLYLLLLIPGSEPPTPAGAGNAPFIWNSDALWDGLESQFAEARKSDSNSVSDLISQELGKAHQHVSRAAGLTLDPESKEFDEMEASVFQLGALVAACPEQLEDYLSFCAKVRVLAKEQSVKWDLSAAAARARIYRMLTGTRVAIEEVMLQMPQATRVPELTRYVDEASETPALEFRGIRLHSGDILLSRGNAPTSALIARGNDRPGSFSHVALLHVTPQGAAVVIESHIECGVTVSAFEKYLADTKLRILVLRLRADRPEMLADSMLPHKAAEAALLGASSRHIPYDFAMDGSDPREQFCSEVVLSAYADRGVRLWLGKTQISNPVAVAWLGSVGVRHFETEEPADLEQDPQLQLVCEWRQRDTLFKAHVDDAVIDAMIENGVPGRALEYRRWFLPVARISKAYSVVLNWVGGIGPVPEGMNATQASRVRLFRARHTAIAASVIKAADGFKAVRGYSPPYWELVDLAKAAVADAARN